MRNLKYWSKKSLLQRIIRTDEELSHYQRLCSDLWQAIATEIVSISNNEAFCRAKNTNLERMRETIRAIKK